MHSKLLQDYIEKLQVISKCKKKSILDLACGGGRNGLYLIENKIPTVFADAKPSALEQVRQSLLVEPYLSNKALADLWLVDFEKNILANDNIDNQPLRNKLFAAIIIFRYLHRPLFEQIKQAIVPGGMVIYETFTVDQAQFGRPKNPDFLLNHGELTQIFSDWKILHSFEGIVENSNNGEKQAIAQIVAIKSE